jgi:hypothetical protein
MMRLEEELWVPYSTQRFAGQGNKFKEKTQ